MRGNLEALLAEQKRKPKASVRQKQVNKLTDLARTKVGANILAV